MNPALHRAEGLLLYDAAAHAGPNGSIGGAIPASDPFETGFTTGQRNIFRQSFQKRADASLVKMTNFTERYALKYTFDVYNLTNTTSFDVPRTRSRRTCTSMPSRRRGRRCCRAHATRRAKARVTSSFYNCPSGLGIVTHTIGSPRQMQMSLALTF